MATAAVPIVLSAMVVIETKVVVALPKPLLVQLVLVIKKTSRSSEQSLRTAIGVKTFRPKE